MISAHSLTRRFGSTIAVDDLTFEVGRSEIVALLGPNGAGKTTTMRMLGGLIRPTDGHAAIDGIRLTPASGTSLRRRIGFLPEAPGLWDRLTVRENLEIYAGLYCVADAPAKIARLLGVFELSDRATTRTAELSKGLRQKVALARTLLHEPDALLLDEPTSGLDPEVARSVRHMLEERRAAGCAILISTHNLDEAERVADRIAVVRKRLLAIDSPAALRGQTAGGRLLVRVAGDPARYAAVIRTFDAASTIDDGGMHVSVADLGRDTPRLVRDLVAEGADLLEVRSDAPTLEEIYLQLIARAADGTVSP